MSEMVERVARAIKARREAGNMAGIELGRGEVSIVPFTGQTECVRLSASDDDLARAAIEAMREPTEGMVCRGWEVLYPKAHTTAGKIWDAMVDEALK